MAVSVNLLLPRWSAFLLFLFVLCSSGAKVVTIDVRAAKGLIQTGSIYLDVRTVEEFVIGHVDAVNIVNVPYMLNTPKGKVKNPDFLKEVSSACNKEDHLIVGCQGGVRSLYATADLLSDGFKNVKDMGGGYVDWVKNKFPVNIPGAKEEL
ncbi:Rhodanese domain-containing protein 17 [Spatholobus suberectus]|nr:Rhodanese domain-containing protein 17 [Spatholobus suberectus]